MIIETFADIIRHYDSRSSKGHVSENNNTGTI